MRAALALSISHNPRGSEAPSSLRGQCHSPEGWNFGCWYPNYQPGWLPALLKCLVRVPCASGEKQGLPGKGQAVLICT